VPATSTPQRIEYRLAVLAYRCQYGLAPSYLSTQLHRVTDVESRRRLRSASTTVLVVPRTHHQTIGDRAFPAAASRVWNSLSPAVTMSTSLTSFQRNLETELLRDPMPTHNPHHLFAVSRVTILFCIVTLKFVRTIRLVHAVRFSFIHSITGAWSICKRFTPG
jgi:hypothetical protein